MSANHYLWRIGLALNLFLALSVKNAWAINYPMDPFDTNPAISLSTATEDELSWAEFCGSDAKWEALSRKDIAYRVICNNLKLKNSIETIKIQAAKHGQAIAMRMPALNLNSSYNARNTASFNIDNRPELEVTGDSEKQRKTGLYMSLPLFSSGATIAAVKSASAAVRAAVFDAQELFETLLSDTLNAYYEYYRAQGLVTVYEHARSFASQNAEISRQREIGGVASRSEVLQAEAVLAKSEIDLRRAREDIQAKRIELAGFLSISPHLLTTAQIKQDQVVSTKPFNPDFKDDLLSVIEARTSYASALARFDAANHKVNQMNREGLPSISLTAGVADQNLKNKQVISQQGIEKTVGVVLTVPLFEGFSRNYKMQEVYAQREISRHEVQDIRLRLESEMTQNKTTFLQERELQQFAQRYLQVSDASYKAALQRYRMGLTEIIEVLNAQRELTNAESEYLNSTVRFSMAKLKVNRDYGRIADEFELSDLKFQIK